MSEPKILLVEDELSLAEGIKLNLELEGLACTWIPRGDQALKQILAETYDLVILDVMLPGLDGYTICERVREAKNFTPILFLTAKNTDDDRVHGFETGADDYLGKPFQVRELLLRIRAILRRESWYKSREINSRQTFGAYWVDFDNFCGEGPGRAVPARREGVHDPQAAHGAAGPSGKPHRHPRQGLGGGRLPHEPHRRQLHRTDPPGHGRRSPPPPLGPHPAERGLPVRP